MYRERGGQSGEKEAYIRRQSLAVSGGVDPANSSKRGGEREDYGGIRAGSQDTAPVDGNEG